MKISSSMQSTFAVWVVTLLGIACLMSPLAVLAAEVEPAGGNQDETAAAEAAAAENLPAENASAETAVAEAAPAEIVPEQKAPARTSTATGSPADSSLVMAGGQEGTVFRSLTVEGENRIQIQFERPELTVDLDPQQAPGLAWGSALDVLDRTVPDLVTPYLANTASWRSPYTPRPWVNRYATGSLARFQPAVSGVESWKLLVVDSRGEVVKEYADGKKLPKEIAWDGTDIQGNPVAPGLTYSYVFEAFDRAGNKRRIVGEGFQLPPYRLESDQGPIMLISGQQWLAADRDRTNNLAANPYLVETASWLNLYTAPRAPVQVTATARSFEEAKALGQKVQAALAPLLNGDPARLAVVTRVEPGAAEGGSLRIGPAPPSGSKK